MRRALLAFALLFTAAALLSGMNAGAAAPTPPPAPRPTATRPRPRAPRPTRSPSPAAARSRPTSTPTASPTPTSSGTFTPIPSFTPVPSPSPSPTPRLNLRLQVYLDQNANGLFDAGEGVDDLLLIISASAWAGQLTIQSGQAWLALPPDLPPSAPVLVQSPYLGWSERIKAPEPGEIATAVLRLELPQFPAYLP